MTPAPSRWPRLLLAWVVGVSAFAFSFGAAAQAPPRTPPQAAPPVVPDALSVDVDPIRCWWRASAGAVRTGETFSLLLTCAALETDAIRIVPDEARLAQNQLQVEPFEIVSGSHPADLRTANRRFFQYEYVLRMINPDFIGRDVRVPDLAIHYRVNTRTSGDAALEGRDLVYLLPTQQVRILSAVGADAYDIRDSSSELFATVESLGFRANMLRIVAATLAALGGLVGLLAFVHLVGRATKRGPAQQHVLSTRAVLATARTELTAIQRESEHGWTEALTGRALAAARVVGACAIDHPASQVLVGHAVPTPEGRLTRSARRGKAIAVWSAVTPRHLTQRLASRTAPPSAHRRPLVEQMQTALATLTTAQYARAAALERSSLDAALSGVSETVRALLREHAWPKPLLRRWRDGEAVPPHGS